MSALLPAQAQAGDILSLIRPGANNASDEDREFLIDRVGTVRGQIDVGDSLRAIFGMTTLNATSGNLGGITGNDEWTGIYQGKVTSKQSLGGGLVLFTLGPDPASEADLSGGIGPATGFVPGPLGTIAAVEPLLGLLGTVLGMMQVFGEIVDAGIGQGARLAGGISVALITTAAGLMVSIPTLMFHRYFVGKVNSLAIGMEEQAFKLVEVIQGQREGDEE